MKIISKSVHAAEEDIEVTQDNVYDLLDEIIELNGADTILNELTSYLSTDNLLDFVDTLIRYGYYYSE